MASQLARQLGPGGGCIGGYTHIHMPYRLDKSCSALAEARLKNIW